MTILTLDEILTTVFNHSQLQELVGKVNIHTNIENFMEYYIYICKRLLNRYGQCNGS